MQAARTIKQLACALALGFAIGVPCRAADLTIAVSRGPVSLPIYVAEAQGYFEREGVAVRINECASGRSCFQLLAQGQADAATAAELLVTLDSFTGSSVAIIATLSSSARNIKLVTRGDNGIKVPQDLGGKRVGTVTGTSAEYFLDRWLVFHEMEPNQVHIIPLAPDQLVLALQRREVDAIAIWEPIASTALAAVAPGGIVMTSPRVYTQHFTLVASRQAISHREADLIKLLRALARAERFIAEQPAQAKLILKARLIRVEGLENLFEHDFHLTLEQSLIATMDGQARWAVRQGVVRSSGPGNLLRSIEPALLREAVPGAVSLVQ